MLRKTLFWLHLTTGVCAGLIVVIMAATGALLAYQAQIENWMNLRGLDGAAPAAHAQPLPVQQLLTRARTARQGVPSAVLWRPQADDPVEVRFGNRSVFLHAYTGEVLSTGSERTRRFFEILMRIHITLGVPWGWRTFGAGVVGLANLGFLFLVLSGLVLWWPRRWHPAAVRNTLAFRRGLSSKARDFNWHNVIGFWSLVPLFIIAFSGALLSYSLAGTALDRLVLTVAPDAPRQPARPPTEQRAVPQPAQLDALIARAKLQQNDWRTLTMLVQPTPRGGILFKIDRGTTGQPHKHAELVLAADGSVMRWQPFSELSNTQKARRMLRFAHTGEVGGVIGQTIAALVSAGALLLAYTGIALALRRWLAWRSRRSGRDHSARKPRARPIPA